MAKTSLLGSILPLIVVIAILSVGGWVGYQVYLSVGQIGETASERFNRRHGQKVVFTKEGVRVGVKSIKNEKYVDTTQSWVVKAWNLGTAKEENGADAKKRR